MSESRIDPARERDSDNPATVAGFFVGRVPTSLRERAAAARSSMARPSVEPLAQRGYELERVFELAIAVALALMEGGFLGVVADKMYDVHPAALALISAAPMFGNLSSFFWSRLAQGRPKVPFIVGLEVLFLAFVAAIALLPEGPAGGGLLVAIMVLSRLVLGGIISIRSLVWTLNYPRNVRGRVTSRLAMLSALTITLVSMAGGAILDANPESFRMLYAIGALVALAGVVAFSRVQIVDETLHLVEERQASQHARASKQRLLPMMFGLLRDDPLYARYLSWMFMLGVSNMIVEGPLIYLVSRELGASYSVSIAITVVIPFAVALLTVPFWAVYIDRVHVAEFRSRHSWLFVVSQFTLFLGALMGSLWTIALGRAIGGVGKGGGMLAWQLGHNDFADRDRVGLYMGVHVSLTGLRGCFAPFLGMLLYVGWEPISMLGIEVASFDGIGGSVMLLACSLSLIASLGFGALHRHISQLRSPQA